MEAPSLSTLAAYATLTLVSYWLFIAVYRLLFHPLAKYPGPLVAKVTGAWSGYYAIRRNLHLKTREAVLKHGRRTQTLLQGCADLG
jgi:hypothetical protein